MIRLTLSVALKSREDVRCPWARNPLAIRYHDEEWGVPVHEDTALFELLILEGAQAGLSWDTILAKRERYREAFDGFDAAKIALYSQKKIAALLQDAGIVRNRLKVASAVKNSKAFLAVHEEFQSFDDFLWQFVDGEPILNSWQSSRQVPASSAESNRMSKELKRRGFSFVGSTICYAFMQATGMVNDHLVDCFRHAQLQPPR